MRLRYMLTALPFTALLLAGCANTANEPPIGQADSRDIPQIDAQNDLRQQASRGDPDSQFQLGSRYFVSQPKDLKQAEHWWKQAAEKGHAGAAVSLAYLYTGRDKPELRNPQQMLKYLNQSAAGGNAMAQHILGNLYLSGEQGVPKDSIQAKQLFQSACQQQYSASCQALHALQ